MLQITTAVCFLTLAILLGLAAAWVGHNTDGWYTEFLSFTAGAGGFVSLCAAIITPIEFHKKET